MAIPSFTYEPNYSVDTTPFDSASNYLDQAAKSAMPSQAAYDTAAARIRSRLEAKQRGDENRALDVFGRSGNAGQYNQQFRQARQDSQRNLATGLADLEEGFWGKQQEGANTLANIARQFSDIGTSKAEAGRQGEQLKMDAARGNANSFNSILSTLGQSGGVLSLFAKENPGLSDPLKQLFGEQFKFIDPNAISSFTAASLAPLDKGGGNATPPDSTGTPALGTGSPIKQSDYSMAAGLFYRPDGTPRLQLKNGRLFDPDSGLYVMSDADYQATIATGAKPMVINGIPFYSMDTGGIGLGTDGAPGGEG